MTIQCVNSLFVVRSCLEHLPRDSVLFMLLLIRVIDLIIVFNNFNC